ncbi:hypothetical protein [Streptomyces decoyicus]
MTDHRRERYTNPLRHWGLLDGVNAPEDAAYYVTSELMAVADSEQRHAIQDVTNENARLRTELEQMRAQAEKAEAAIERVKAYAHELRHKDATGLLAALDRPATGPAEHTYLSTGCLHGEHGYCQGHTGLSGAKTPAVCKFCKAPCQCPCHKEA